MAIDTNGVGMTQVSKPHLKGILSNVGFRRVLWQVITALVLFGALGWMISNLQYNLTVRNITSGFGFLNSEAGLPIAEHLIPYEPTDSYFRALLVGTLNTLWVAFCGIFLSTIIGVSIGVARLSRNWLLAKVASIYVEFFRDIPLLLQLLLWYTLLQKLPSVRQALQPVAGVILSNRGLSFPALIWSTAHVWVFVALVVGIVASIFLSRSATRKRLDDGRHRRVWPFVLGLVIVLPTIVSLIVGASYAIEFPQARGFNVTGGSAVSPEFFALLLGLVVYNAAFIAEIVRSGLQSVSHGQHEAARALGLRSNSTLRWIVFPQALRVIIPPLTSQYLNLTKSSSLAVAIGYQDLVSVANTAMNQGGHAIELVGIIMAVYLTISLTISFLMNIYNARMALVER